MKYFGQYLTKIRIWSGSHLSSFEAWQEYTRYIYIFWRIFNIVTKRILVFIFIDLNNQYRYKLLQLVIKKWEQSTCQFAQRLLWRRKAHT